MHVRDTCIVAMILVLLLMGCRGQSAGETHGETASETTVSLSASTVSTSRPSAPLGVYVSFFLARGRLVATGAVRAIEALVAFARQFGGNAAEASEIFALLQSLGASLQVNLPDYLNRATDRQLALDEYTRELQNLGTQAQHSLVSLEQSLKDLRVQTKTQRDRVRSLERTIRDALKDQRYSDAGAQQEEVGVEQRHLQDLETQEKELNRIIDLLRELLDFAQERLTGILQNRDVLVAGLRVVETPGIEELGILEGGRRRRQRSGTEFNPLGGL